MTFFENLIHFRYNHSIGVFTDEEFRFCKFDMITSIVEGSILDIILNFSWWRQSDFRDVLPYIVSTIHGTRSLRLITEYISLEASRLGKHERKERLICNDWIIRHGKHTVDIILGGSLMAAEFFVYLT